MAHGIPAYLRALQRLAAVPVPTATRLPAPLAYGYRALQSLGLKSLIKIRLFPMNLQPYCGAGTMGGRAVVVCARCRHGGSRWREGRGRRWHPLRGEEPTAGGWVDPKQAGDVGLRLLPSGHQLHEGLLLVGLELGSPAAAPAPGPGGSEPGGRVEEVCG
jgi:hypothetical protein